MLFVYIFLCYSYVYLYLYGGIIISGRLHTLLPQLSYENCSIYANPKVPKSATKDLWSKNSLPACVPVLISQISGKAIVSLLLSVPT